MKFIILLLSLSITLNVFANDEKQEKPNQACNTEYQQDLLFCADDLDYSVDVLNYDKINSVFFGYPSKNQKFTYVLKTIDFLANQYGDTRFKKTDVKYSHPSDGEFKVFYVRLDNKKYVFVYWDDADDSSYSFLYESPDSYKMIYSNYEN